jgi:hypothetical protein
MEHVTTDIKCLNMHSNPQALRQHEGMTGTAAKISRQTVSRKHVVASMLVQLWCS